MALESNRIYNLDCLEGMASLDGGSADLILCDLPYGTTQNKWDSVLPLDRLWLEYRRIVKPHGAIILTATQPFTTDLISSNREWFRHEWIWRKNVVTGHLNAHRQPMRAHETILVFSPHTKTTYNPQDLVAYQRIKRRGTASSSYGHHALENYQEWTNYPRTVLEFACGEAGNAAGASGTPCPDSDVEYVVASLWNIYADQYAAQQNSGTPLSFAT